MISNLLGAAGLTAIAVAVGALAGDWWWSALAGGVFAVILAGVAQYNAARGADETAKGLTAQSEAPVKPFPRLVDRVSRSA